MKTEQDDKITIDLDASEILKAIVNSAISDILPTEVPYNISKKPNSGIFSFIDKATREYVGTIVFDTESGMFSCYDKNNNCQHYNGGLGLMVHESALTRKFTYFRVDENENFLFFLSKLYGTQKGIYAPAGSLRRLPVVTTEEVQKILKEKLHTGTFPGIRGEFIYGLVCDVSKNLLFGEAVPDDIADFFSMFRKKHPDCKFLLDGQKFSSADSGITYIPNNRIICFHTNKYDLVYELDARKLYFFGSDTKPNILKDYGISFKTAIEDVTGDVEKVVELFIKKRNKNSSLVETPLTVPNFDRDFTQDSNLGPKKQMQSKTDPSFNRPSFSKLYKQQTGADSFYAERMQPVDHSHNTELKNQPSPLQQQQYKTGFSYPQESKFTVNNTSFTTNTVTYKVNTTSTEASTYQISLPNYIITLPQAPVAGTTYWIQNTSPYNWQVLPAEKSDEKERPQESTDFVVNELKKNAKEAFIRTATKKTKKELAKVLATAVIASGNGSKRNKSTRLQAIEDFLLSDAGSAFLGAFIAAIIPLLKEKIPEKTFSYLETFAEECRISGIAWMQEEVVDFVLETFEKVDFSSLLVDLEPEKIRVIADSSPESFVSKEELLDEKMHLSNQEKTRH